MCCCQTDSERYGTVPLGTVFSTPLPPIVLELAYQAGRQTVMNDLATLFLSFFEYGVVCAGQRYRWTPGVSTPGL